MRSRFKEAGSCEFRDAVEAYPAPDDWKCLMGQRTAEAENGGTARKTR
jgi:hypothetical protein